MDNYRYGLTCISEILKESDKISYKTITRKRFKQLGESAGKKELSSRILHNIKLIPKIIQHCDSLGIRHYRIPDIFPLITDKTLNLSLQDLPDTPEIIQNCQVIGNIVKETGVTVSSHPGQFTLLGSTNSNINESGIRDLNLVGYFFDLCGFPRSVQSPINIHAGRSAKVPGDYVEIAELYYNNLMKCDPSVQSRLVIENDDKGSWNCKSLYTFFYKHLKQKYGFGFSLTFDNLHHKCNPSGSSTEWLWLNTFMGTWPENIIPVMHWSEGGAGGKIRAHSDYITIGKPPRTDCIWEVEVKAKDKAIVKLLSC